MTVIITLESLAACPLSYYPTQLEEVWVTRQPQQRTSLPQVYVSRPQAPFHITSGYMSWKQARCIALINRQIHKSQYPQSPEKPISQWSNLTQDITITCSCMKCYWRYLIVLNTVSPVSGLMSNVRIDINLNSKSMEDCRMNTRYIRSGLQSCQ